MVFSIHTTLLHHPGANQHSNRVLAVTIVAVIPWVYQEYIRVFNKVAANELPKHRP